MEVLRSVDGCHQVLNSLGLLESACFALGCYIIYCWQKNLRAKTLGNGFEMTPEGNRSLKT